MEPANTAGEDNLGSAGLLAGKDQGWEFDRGSIGWAFGKSPVYLLASRRLRGRIPVKDGSGNILHGTGGSYYDRALVNITSLGDEGTISNNFGNTLPLNTALPLSVNNTPLSGFWNCTNVTPVTLKASTTGDRNLMSCLIRYQRRETAVDGVPERPVYGSGHALPYVHLANLRDGKDRGSVILVAKGDQSVSSLSVCVLQC